MLSRVKKKAGRFYSWLCALLFGFELPPPPLAPSQKRQTFGAYLRELRDDRGVSCREAALVLDLTRRDLMLLEGDLVSRVSPRVLMNIASYYFVKLSALRERVVASGLEISESEFEDFAPEAAGMDQVSLPPEMPVTVIDEESRVTTTVASLRDIAFVPSIQNINKKQDAAYISSCKSEDQPKLDYTAAEMSMSAVQKDARRRAIEGRVQIAHAYLQKLPESSFTPEARHHYFLVVAVRERLRLLIRDLQSHGEPLFTTAQSATMTRDTALSRFRQELFACPGDPVDAIELVLTTAELEALTGRLR